MNQHQMQNIEGRLAPNSNRRIYFKPPFLSGSYATVTFQLLDDKCQNWRSLRIFNEHCVILCNNEEKTWEEFKDLVSTSKEVLFEKLVEFRLESISKSNHEHGSLSVVLAIVKTDGTTKTVHLNTSFAILMS